MIKNGNSNALNFIPVMDQIGITPSYSSHTLFWCLLALRIAYCTFRAKHLGVVHYLLMVAILKDSRPHIFLSISTHLMSAMLEDNRPTWVFAMCMKSPSLETAGCVWEEGEGILISRVRIEFGANKLVHRSVSDSRLAR